MFPCLQIGVMYTIVSGDCLLVRGFVGLWVSWLWLCGFVASLVGGCVGLSVCSFVGLWVLLVCGLVGFGVFLNKHNC